MFSTAALALIILRKTGVIVPFVTNYFTDLLAVPIICSLALAFQRRFVEPAGYRFKAGHVIFVVVYTAIVFEWLLPQFTARYTADGIDVVLYILGGLLFWFLLNK